MPMSQRGLSGAGPRSSSTYFDDLWRTFLLHPVTATRRATMISARYAARRHHLDPIPKTLHGPRGCPGKGVDHGDMISP